MARRFRFLNSLWAAITLGAATASAEPMPPLEDPVALFAAWTDLRNCGGHPGATVAIAPDTWLPPVLTPTGAGLEVRYPMAFNQLTEGWSWRPGADPGQEDYYRYQYLPLISVPEAGPPYRFEDKLGEPQQMQVRRRYDYFLAFDNLYDFFPRGGGDDAGFSALIATTGPDAVRLAGGDLGLAARLVPTRPCTAESTTFWKATHAHPEDFTLKKRYLLGILDEVLFYDRRGGEILARLRRSSTGRGSAPGQNSRTPDRSP